MHKEQSTKKKKIEYKLYWIYKQLLVKKKN